ncbi:MAG: hypothetical protein IH933_10470 [Euryarchaeota archaeon]|nr:hypothetical protein [Euryarchaeota archaeon]
MSADGGEQDGHAVHLEHALKERAAFEPPENPDERSLSYLCEGLWPVLERYIAARSSGERLSEEEHDELERALNTWLELYALCYGVEIDAAFSVREGAELFVGTHDLRDTAQLLTHVPNRREVRTQDY